MAHRVLFQDRFFYRSFLLALLFGCSQNVDKSANTILLNSNTTGLSMVNGRMFKDAVPFSGTLFTLGTKEKDTLEYKGYYNGYEDGEWKEFYETGRLKSIRYFEQGRKTGSYVAWWPDGKKLLEYVFKEGEYEGPCKEWNSDGILVNEHNYLKGYEEGIQKQYYDNGKIKSNYTMLNGKRYGLLGTKNCVNASDSIFKE